MMKDLAIVNAEIKSKEAAQEALQDELDDLYALRDELAEAEVDEDEYTGPDPSTQIGNIFYRQWMKRKGWSHPRLGVGNHPGLRLKRDG